MLRVRNALESWCYDICPICFWEDDGQDDEDADDSRGGPNHVSLTEARINFLRVGAAEPEDRPHVRAPLPTDKRVRVFVLENGRVVDRSYEAISDTRSVFVFAADQLQADGWASRGGFQRCGSSSSIREAG